MSFLNSQLWERKICQCRVIQCKDKFKRDEKEIKIDKKVAFSQVVSQCCSTSLKDTGMNDWQAYQLSEIKSPIDRIKFWKLNRILTRKLIIKIIWSSHTLLHSHHSIYHKPGCVRMSRGVSNPCKYWWQKCLCERKLTIFRIRL